MKTYFYSVVFFIIISTFCPAQGTLTVETDKSNYSYGETIEVKVKLSNDSDTSFSIWGSSSCIARISLDTVSFRTLCTADYTEFPFGPHSSRTWVWELKPDSLGIPVEGGEHLIRCNVAGRIDSIKFNSPSITAV